MQSSRSKSLYVFLFFVFPASYNALNEKALYAPNKRFDIKATVSLKHTDYSCVLRNVYMDVIYLVSLAKNRLRVIYNQPR
jgi:hypothetical protein